MGDQGTGIGPTGSSQPGNIRPEEVGRKDRARKPESAGKIPETTTPAGTEKTDLMVISGPAKQIAHLRDLIREVPDVRSAKVMEIKNRVDRGEYHVPARDILRKMVETAVAEARNRKGEP
ncbi:MAG: flagellar biosynthesis anti-sigma factor FlgM [Nitrospirae bacterium]|jgi:negative regulator of flagellin synthesis FlgM|nr:flagellar biosynthesis anti-sigma factor FlgM [Nitrospirota bacterium]